jgi:hypothetical protein
MTTTRKTNKTNGLKKKFFWVKKQEADQEFCLLHFLKKHSKINHKKQINAKTEKKKFYWLGCSLFLNLDEFWFFGRCVCFLILLFCSAKKKNFFFTFFSKIKIENSLNKTKFLKKETLTGKLVALKKLKQKNIFFLVFLFQIFLLVALTTDAAGEGKVAGEEGDALGVEGKQVRVGEEGDDVRLGRLLEGGEGRRLPAQNLAAVRVARRDVADEALEGSLAHERFGRRLVLLDLAEDDGAGSPAVLALGLGGRLLLLGLDELDGGGGSGGGRLGRATDGSGGGRSSGLLDGFGGHLIFFFFFDRFFFLL